MRGTFTRATTLYLATLLVHWPTYAQPFDVAFEKVPLPGGFTGNAVVSIVLDHQGFMWFGTWEGLHRYDGDEIARYVNIPGDSSSRSDSWVSSLYVDREGTLWIGTHSGGLNRFDHKTETFTHFRHHPDDPKSLTSDAVTAVLEDHEGMLWAGTQRGLNRLDPATGNVARFRCDPADPLSTSIHKYTHIRVSLHRASRRCSSSQ